MEDLKSRLQRLLENIEAAMDKLNIDEDKSRLSGLDKRAQEPDFWKDPEDATWRAGITY
jgi:hypothetical protein